MRLPRPVVRALLRGLVQPVMCQDRLPVALRRRWLDVLAAASTRPLPGTRVTTTVLAGRPCEVVTAAGAGAGGGAVLHLHGGGFTTGSPRVYRALASHLSAAVGAPVHVLDYRLAPEHPYPAGLQDCVAAVRALAATGPVVVSGDSAGGNLALALTLALQREGGPTPVALALQSPVTDLTLGRALAASRTDPVLTLDWLRANARDYAPGVDLSDPLLSPLHADGAALAGLPPVLVHVAEQDLLHDEGVLLAERLRDAGVAVELVEHPGLWHVHHVQAGQLRAADDSLAAVGAWLRPHLLAAAAPAPRAASYRPPRGQGSRS